VIDLLGDQDKDVRAVGLEQVRDQVKGAEATRRFTALLPRLSPEAQAGLLAALAERGDAAARAGVLDRIADGRPEVRSAAIRALGALGGKDDVAQLVGLLAKANSEKDAVAAVTRLRGEGVNAALVAEAKRWPPAVRVKVLTLLMARHAIETAPALLEAAGQSDATVRSRALEALGQLAGPEHVAELARLVLKTQNAAAREEAERAVMLICQRIPEADKQSQPLLAFMDRLGEGDKTALLPTLGRIGGRPVLAIVESALSDRDSRRREAGLRALCNWPDGGVAPRLLDIARSAGDKQGRELALDALIRIAPLPDKRPDAVRLAMLRSALELATRGDQKTAILKRARAIRTLDALHLVAPYLGQPEFAQVAAETVVDLARHKGLRQPNKAEFDRVLDKAIEISKDPGVIDRAKRYKQNRT
jgi:HEAT repeat protein